jgi:hypothetical protein
LKQKKSANRRSFFWFFADPKIIGIFFADSFFAEAGAVFIGRRFLPVRVTAIRFSLLGPSFYTTLYS